MNASSFEWALPFLPVLLPIASVVLISLLFFLLSRRGSAGRRRVKRSSAKKGWFSGMRRAFAPIGGLWIRNRVRVRYMVLNWLIFAFGFVTVHQEFPEVWGQYIEGHFMYWIVGALIVGGLLVDDRRGRFGNPVAPMNRLQDPWFWIGSGLIAFVLFMIRGCS